MREKKFLGHFIHVRIQKCVEVRPNVSSFVRSLDARIARVNGNFFRQVVPPVGNEHDEVLVGIDHWHPIPVGFRLFLKRSVNAKFSVGTKKKDSVGREIPLDLRWKFVPLGRHRIVDGEFGAENFLSFAHCPRGRRRKEKSIFVRRHCCC